MSLTILPASCIDCGACEQGCPTGAIHRPEEDPGCAPVFWVDTNCCNDCGWCTTVCPADCVLTDPDTVICRARGCPLAPGRHGPFAGWECSALMTPCHGCGHAMWRADPSMPWVCPRCNLATQARCPKVLGRERGKLGQKALRRSVEELYRYRETTSAGV